MSRISQVFDSIKGNGSAAYIPYICAGDPDRDFTLSLIERLDRAGADIFELGLPFSDPIADGPVIQAAMQRSLAAGFRVDDLFALISSARELGIRQPIVIMSYYNPIMQMGVRRFCERLVDVGGDAILPVDLPLEESELLEENAREHGLDIIRLIAPSTDNSRLELLLSKASGFVYVVSVAGTTGARDSLPDSAISLIGRVAGRSEIPVALGFGISHPNHVRDAVQAGASGVIEGSKLIQTYSEALADRNEALDRVERHGREMKSSTMQ